MDATVTSATPALTAAPFNAVSEDDLVALFEAEEATMPKQLAALSDAEMRETEGALGPLAVTGLWIAGGAVGGAAMHVYRTRSTKEIWRGIGAGATSAFFASPAGRMLFGRHNFAR